MEKIPTKKEFIERLKDTSAVEILARRGYEEDVITFKNFEIKDTMEKIKAEEDEHIEMLKELINMLEKNS